MLENHSQSSIEIRDDRELILPSEIFENLVNLWIKFPNASFRKMCVSRLKKNITIEWINRDWNSVEHFFDEITPPAFVVVFSWLPDGRTTRHRTPNVSEGTIERLSIKS